MRRRRHRHDGKDNPKARRHEGKGREEPGGKGEHLLSILRPRIRVRGGHHRSGADAADVTDHQRGVLPVMVSCGPRYGSGVAIPDPAIPALHRVGFAGGADVDQSEVDNGGRPASAVGCGPTPAARSCLAEPPSSPMTGTCYPGAGRHAGGGWGRAVRQIPLDRSRLAHPNRQRA